MTIRDLNKASLDLIEEWEELVLYVYDDKVPKRHIDGKFRYPEWDGGQVIGTLTIGYGHTDAAGAPKITRGMRITEAQADAILDADLSKCRAEVQAAVKVPLTDNQYGALVSFDFNCGGGNLRKIVTGLNQGDYESVPRRMLQFTHSQGEYMRGLANRRAAEIKLWGTADDIEVVQTQANPRGEQAPPPKSITASKTAAGGATAGTGGIVVLLDQINQVLAKLKDVNATEVVNGLVASPVFWVSLAIVGVSLFIIWDRNQKLTKEHV